jgi:multidrug efflux pump
LKPHAESTPNFLARGFEAGFAAFTRFYDRTLQVVLRHQTTTLVVTVATIAVTVLLAFHVPKGFFPVEDTGTILGVTEAAPDVSFTKMLELQQGAAEVVLGDPDVATVSAFIGADGTNPTQNSGRLSIALRPREDRDADVTEIIARLNHRLAEVRGITVYLQPVQDLTVDARLARTQYQYTIEDPDPDELAEWAPRMLEAMRKLPELRDVASDQQNAGLELHLAVDRDSASRLGITAQALDDTLYDAFGQRIVSTTFTQLNQYRVILELRPEDRENVGSLERIYVRSQSGTAIPLSAIARLETRSTALSIAHQSQFPSVTLSFNTAPDVSLGDATAAIDRV